MIEIRWEIKVLFYSSESWLSRLIQHVTGSDYSHVAVMLNSNLYEALGHGVTRREGDEAHARARHAKATIKLPVEMPDYFQALGFLDRQVPAGYSKLGFLAAGIAKLTGWRVVISVGNRWICSGVASAALARAGYEPPRRPELMTPADMWEWLSRNDSIVRTAVGSLGLSGIDVSHDEGWRILKELDDEIR